MKNIMELRSINHKVRKKHIIKRLAQRALRLLSVLCG